MYSQQQPRTLLAYPHNNSLTSFTQSRVSSWPPILEQPRVLTHSSSYLQKYRTAKPNLNYKIQRQENNTSILPAILCTLLGIGGTKEQNSDHKSIKCVCACNKNQEGLCELVMAWVEGEYYWRTDKQFMRIYGSYQLRKLDEKEYAVLTSRLERVLDVLGLDIDAQEVAVVAEVLANYTKHALYYNKAHNSISQSDIYVWICLGICYHVGFHGGSTTQLQKTIMFWALDIAMDSLCDLQPQALTKVHIKALKQFEVYFPRWLQLLTSRNINPSDLLYEWIQELMFGFMGIEPIVFFVDCMRKSGWDYFIKVMMSYFEARTKDISKNQRFLNGSIERDQLIGLLVNGKEEWPMVFCNASSFNIKE